MKYFIDGVIVVEGKQDVCYLSSFIDTFYVTTNGYDLPKEEIDFLKNVSKIKQVIILTDPDDAGKQIREKLIKEIPSAKNVVVDISKCNRNGKHGIAECEKKEVISALKDCFSAEKSQNLLVLTDLPLLDSYEREFMCKELKLGKCNQKQFMKRVALLNISIEQIEKVRKSYHGN